MSAIEKAMKSNSSIRLVYAKKQPRKMIWADDTHQWEVYELGNARRGIIWYYKGQDVQEALKALTGEL